MTLVASVVTSHGRTTPVAWETIDKDELTGHRLAAEERIVALLKDSLPPTCTKVGHHSRSGIRRWRTLGDAITKRGFDFGVIRIKGDILVTNSNGQQYAAADWISPTGSTKTMKDREGHRADAARRNLRHGAEAPDEGALAPRFLSQRCQRPRSW